MNVVGPAIPAIGFIDDSGETRSMGDLAGSPTILVPIYTRCHGSCPTVAASLKNAILQSSTPTGAYHVVLFSFDSRETSQDLKHFREHEHLPFQWTMARASEKDSDALTQSIGFRYTRADGEFLHPNLVAVLDSRLRVAKLLEGENYTAGEIDQALSFAKGREDWKGSLELPVLCIGLLLLTISTGYLIHLLTRRT